MLTRRDFLKAAGLTGLLLAAPSAFALPQQRKVLLLVELAGGNDGLNTVVPYGDPLYRKLRPTIGVDHKSVLSLDDRRGLHPKLAGLAAAWEKGELAIVEGVGYPRPNRSHFRSIEIWESATDADAYDPRGWIAQVVPDADIRTLAPAGLTLGTGEDGPLAGANALALDDPDALIRVARRLERSALHTDNPALRHVLETQNRLLDAVGSVERRLASAPDFGDVFGSGPAARPLEAAAKLIAAGLPILAVRVRVPGFDTHTNQPGRHGRLMEVLDRGLGAFRTAMIGAGCWDDLLIVTYSEFGRRPRENGAAGTDHGTAAPQLVLGGSVRGGFYGNPPSLSALDTNGDLVHSVDFRQVYATIAERWWGLGDHKLSGYPQLGFV